MPVLVDSNVLLDVLTEDPRWCAWSAQALAEQAERAADNCGIRMERLLQVTSAVFSEC